MADPRTHKRYLDYRETHMYFGAKTKMLDYATFEALDKEQAALAAKGEDARDDEEEVRFAEVNKLLFRD